MDEMVVGTKSHKRMMLCCGIEAAVLCSFEELNLICKWLAMAVSVVVVVVVVV